MSRMPAVMTESARTKSGEIYDLAKQRRQALDTSSRDPSTLAVSSREICLLEEIKSLCTGSLILNNVNSNSSLFSIN